MKAQIIFISGYICSGKSSYIEQNYPDHDHIKVSDIVRKIIGRSQRKELQDTAYLDKTIAQEICEYIGGNLNANYVIDGIRQPSIFAGIISYLNDFISIPFELIWLEVPIEQCKTRFELKKDGKENISFEQAFENDKTLGLLHLEQLWKHSLKRYCTIINNS